MKKIKSILLWCYCNWLLFFIALNSVSVFWLGVTAWSFLYAPLIIVVLCFISVPSYCSTLRHLTWPMYRSWLIKNHLKKFNVLVSFPMVLWVELEGKDIFLKKGYFALMEGMHGHGKSVCEKMLEVLKNNPLDTNLN